MQISTNCLFNILKKPQTLTPNDPEKTHDRYCAIYAIFRINFRLKFS